MTKDNEGKVDGGEMRAWNFAAFRFSEETFNLLSFDRPAARP